MRSVYTNRVEFSYESEVANDCDTVVLDYLNKQVHVKLATSESLITHYPISMPHPLSVASAARDFLLAAREGRLK